MAAALTRRWLHPQWRVRVLAMRWRLVATLRARPGARVALAGVAIAVVAYASAVRWSVAAGLPARVADAPLVPTILMFALAYVAARAAVATNERQMRHGFTAALPVGDAARRRTSLLFALVAAGVARLAVGVPFAFAPVDVPTTFDAATLLAALVAWLATRRWSAAQRTYDNPALHQVPKLFFASRTPVSRRFPHLPRWQRLRATAHWRTTGRAWQLGAIALLLPRNAGIIILAMLVVLGTMLWWSVMMRAAVSVLLDARALLAALHVDRVALAREALRYPAVATALAAIVVFGVPAVMQ
jgi:hypothetical protein